MKKASRKRFVRPTVNSLEVIWQVRIDSPSFHPRAMVAASGKAVTSSQSNSSCWYRRSQFPVRSARTISARLLISSVPMASCGRPV